MVNSKKLQPDSLTTSRPKKPMAIPIKSLNPINHHELQPGCLGFFMFFPHKNQLRPGAQDVLKTLQEECSLLAASSELVG
jgi:hypothetical protein